MNSLSHKDGLDIAWLTDPADLAALGAEWQLLADRVGADVYARPDWMAIWWKHFGANRSLACMVVRSGGVLMGVLPFVVEHIWLGPLPHRIARLAGMDPNCIIFQLSLDNAWTKPALHAAMRHLIDALGCLAVSFTPVSDRASYLPALQGLDGQDDGLAVLIDGAGTHVIFDFTSNFAEYLARLTKARRGQFRRNVRALTDGFAMTREDSVPDAAEFDAFIKFHGLQWQASGRGGHFSDWPGSAAFYHDLAAQTANAKLVQLDRLNGTGGALATEFSLISGRTAHWRLPARRLDAEIDRLSAGKVVFLLMFERMVADGITRIEAGRGEYEYKTDYGGQTVLVHRLIVHRSNGMARRRLKLLLEWADLLNLVYYRLWFLKLSPRLRKLVGGGPRPLWRQWIRTRL